MNAPTPLSEIKLQTKASVAARLAAVRLEKFGKRGKTAMARALGLPSTTWESYEHQLCRVPFEILVRVARLTGKSLRWLALGDEHARVADHSVNSRVESQWLEDELSLFDKHNFRPRPAARPQTKVLVYLKSGLPAMSALVQSAADAIGAPISAESRERIAWQFMEELMTAVDSAREPLPHAPSSEVNP